MLAGLFILAVWGAAWGATWGAVTEQHFSTTITDSSVCEEPVVTGLCRARFERWAFDYAKDQCRQFIYGGCGGTGNNFETREECEKMCRVLESRCAACPQECQATQKDQHGCPFCTCPRVISGVCELPIIVGLCRARFEMYAFDSELGECRLFIYGGCGGNENRFRTLEECQAVCPSAYQTIA